MKITDDLRLDGRIINSIRFNEYLNQAFTDNNMVGKDDKLKWAFEDRFNNTILWIIKYELQQCVKNNNHVIAYSGGFSPLKIATV